MKRYLLPILLLAGSTAFAQAPFLTKEYLDVNKIKAVHMLHGDMWRDPDSGEPSVEFPQGTGKQANYSGAIWTSARDNAGKLYTSAALYTIWGLDFWPGPLNAAGSLDLPTSQKWAKIWKLNQKDITDFQALSTRTVSTVPAVILEWPAKGNIYAKGATGSLLSITDNMAPFTDVNSDGIYNALDGDYPKMKGDQMLWWVFSDNGPSRTLSNGKSLKIEYHASAYAYNREGDAGRILFYEFVMHNKSGLKYEDFRFGVFSEADLGNPFDDYIAFDSSHRMGIEYNAGKTDKPYGIKSYGNHPPVTGLSLLEMPGDINPGPFAPAGTFNIFYASGGPSEYDFDHRVDTQYYNLMRSKSNLGVDRPFGDYAYPISKGAVQCDEVHPLDDRRFILSTGNYVFYPGTTAKVVMAFMVTDTTGDACPGMDFGPITRLADTAWDIYRNPRSLSHKENILAALGLKIWPNPASQQVYINTRVMPEELQVSVYDQLGRRMNVPVQRDATLLTLDISALAPGMYSLHCSNSSGHYSELLLKK